MKILLLGFVMFWFFGWLFAIYSSKKMSSLVFGWGDWVVFLLVEGLFGLICWPFMLWLMLKPWYYICEDEVVNVSFWKNWRKLWS